MSDCVSVPFGTERREGNALDCFGQRWKHLALAAMKATIIVVSRA